MNPQSSQLRILDLDPVLVPYKTYSVNQHIIKQIFSITIRENAK